MDDEDSINDILDVDEHERWSDFSIEEELPLRNGQHYYNNSGNENININNDIIESDVKNGNDNCPNDKGRDEINTEATEIEAAANNKKESKSKTKEECLFNDNNKLCQDETADFTENVQLEQLSAMAEEVVESLLRDIIDSVIKPSHYQIDSEGEHNIRVSQFS